MDVEFVTTRKEYTDDPVSMAMPCSLACITLDLPMPLAPNKRNGMDVSLYLLYYVSTRSNLDTYLT
ncbi:hypothetical protein TCAL_16661 [Tigriopus californicus]|uniref:Uncharacterized protein n=1 Tax=Tigriopus californicus TaxID=6832 RepID=A0A553NDK3_TIGCA|nr:hypothetical protein TCAL_16661 [Tigriopus californicus]